MCTDRPFSTSLLADDDADAAILFLSSTADMAGSVAYAAPSAVIVPAAVDTTLNANPITVSAAKVRDGSTNPALVTLGAEATLPPHVRPYGTPCGPSAPVSRLFLRYTVDHVLTEGTCCAACGAADCSHCPYYTYTCARITTQRRAPCTTKYHERGFESSCPDCRAGKPPLATAREATP